jgi:FMN phosphatase YigB (HAD superfamily)/glycosyltransferase involved in cell wall biosynthesis
MQLAIVHYHLNRGGVAQVILNHLRALGRTQCPGWPERVAILYGGRRHDWPEAVFTDPPPFPVELIELPTLDYDNEPVARADELAGELLAALSDRGFSRDDTILHCHNHSVGKNASLSGALSRLADDGCRMLLQIHDFAEDFRPDNYRHLVTALGVDEPRDLAGLLYPQGPGVHYAVLTRRDRAVLAAAGVAGDRLHLVPNPVAEFDDLPAADAARPAVWQALGLKADARLVVYPARGIRRKNVGEMLLLSALGDRNATFAVTLLPINPAERVSFDRWHALSDELGLPCRFDTAGEGGLAYVDVLSAADALLTTSVAEGFGMVFLEAWLAGRPLVGRNLPEITADFVEEGIRFPWLYDKLSIPMGWLDERELRSEWTSAYRLACGAYGVRPLADQELSQQIDTLLAGGSVDFAALPPALQATVIRRAWTSPDCAAELLVANGELAAVGKIDCDSGRDVILANARSIREHYSLEAIGKRLLGVYQSLAGSPRPNRLEPLPAGRAILDAFLAIRRLQPIRLQSPAPAISPYAELIRRHSRPLRPVPTDVAPRLVRMPNVRAVLFDVYGTLVVSVSGDVGAATGADRAAALAGAFEEIGVSLPCKPADGVARLLETIASHHAAARQLGIEYPEVDIVRVWQDAYQAMAAEGSDASPAGEIDFRRLAVAYEVRVNPVWPMPHVAECLAELRAAGRRLGIVSNAQFFTPELFPALMGRPLAELGFDPRCQYYSYQHGQAKPSEYLYRLAADRLSGEGIAAADVLYIGNDLRNDIWPAAAVGFRTALFAGDACSLRMRQDESELAGFEPDAVVTDLAQVPALLTT